MASMSVRRAADSAPSAGRDFDGERKALLARADEVQARMEGIDMSEAVASTLQLVTTAADVALERGSQAQEAALSKIHEQQERFKAGVIADGGSLDDEYEGARTRASTSSAEDTKGIQGNKYMVMMDRRRQLQEQQR
jgi:hypothetical protein